ncbi:hypothetical protein JRQ81_008241 [Phrynocephalus forsythii]|uniref:Uncharacterized protein n=1 Tax=Phrynocephalus forsythii TaxID=171643 RepID=A0A9Q0XDK0_9SAUR|nr:hypothetical protein JRQ81_008241 [Phrynocephalus forsythii]
MFLICFRGVPLASLPGSEPSPVSSPHVLRPEQELVAGKGSGLEQLAVHTVQASVASVASVALEVLRQQRQQRKRPNTVSYLHAGYPSAPPAPPLLDRPFEGDTASNLAPFFAGAGGRESCPEAELYQGVESCPEAESCQGVESCLGGFLVQGSRRSGCSRGPSHLNTVRRTDRRNVQNSVLGLLQKVTLATGATGPEAGEGFSMDLAPTGVPGTGLGGLGVPGLTYPGAGGKPPKPGYGVGIPQYDGLSPIAPAGVGYGGKPPKPYGALGALGYRGGLSPAGAAAAKAAKYGLGRKRK